MNFQSFTSRLKDKAHAAAQAAKEFKGFDGMAEQDEYIHSESLNVPSRRDEVSISTNAISTITDALSESSSTRHSTRSQQFSVISQPGTASSLVNSFHDSLCSSDDEDDPIMSQLLEEESAAKKQHRFLADLDHRMSQPLEIQTDTMQTNQLEEHVPILNESSSNPSPWRFLKQLSTPSAHITKVFPTPPLSRIKAQKVSQSDDPEANFTTVSSTSVLGSDDLQALNRMQRASSLFDGIRKRPREAFVALTMLVAVFLYFYAHSDNV